MKDIKHIRWDFHSAAWVMARGWDLGVAWGGGGLGDQNFFFLEIQPHFVSCPRGRTWGYRGGLGGQKIFFSEIQPDLVCEFLT